MPRNSSRLLLDEYPLIVMPTLACAVGLNQAIFLQQVHYWCHHYEHEQDSRHYHAGRWWVYNAVNTSKGGPDWRANFPFWSPSTIRRIIVATVTNHLVIQGNYNLAGYDRTGWYTINYDHLDATLDKWHEKQALLELHQPRPFGHNDQMDLFTLTKCMESDRPNASSQSDQMDLVTLTTTIPETTQRLPSFDTDIELIWRQCTHEIALQMTKVAYARWIAPSQLVALNADEHNAIIQCNNEYILDWCQNKLDVIIARTLSGVLGTPITITYKLKEAELASPIHTTT